MEVGDIAVAVTLEGGLEGARRKIIMSSITAYAVNLLFPHHPVFRQHSFKF